MTGISCVSIQFDAIDLFPLADVSLLFFFFHFFHQGSYFKYILDNYTPRQSEVDNYTSSNKKGIGGCFDLVSIVDSVVDYSSLGLGFESTKWMDGWMDG